ncbi:MAG: peptidoglycan DD-metalloendopeptidase family protein [Rhodospirillales bacterium]
MLVLLGVGLIAFGFQALPLQAQSQSTAPKETLKQIEDRIGAEKAAAEAARARAEIMGRDIVSLQNELVSAASAVQRHETQVSALQNRLQALERLRENKTHDLREGRVKFGRVLAAMQRLAQYPPEALIAQPTKPADMVRTAILLRSAVGEIDRQASTLREELIFLARARDEIASREIALTETTELLDRERRRLGALMARKKVLKRRADTQAEEADQRIAELAGKAKTLRDLLEGIKQERSRARKAPQGADRKADQASRVVPSLRPFSKAKGSLSLPATGKINGRYGEMTEAGLSRKGMTIATPSGAQVTATYDGTVVYAGKFRGYGLLLIIEHGEGYHSLLAGMTRIDVEQGRTVLAGEPVGVMEQGASGQPVLYVELRRDGQPINPLPWLAAHKDEVNG